MSVINRTLRELDARQVTQGGRSRVSAPADRGARRSHRRAAPVWVGGLLGLILVSAGMWGWHASAPPSVAPPEIKAQAASAAVPQSRDEHTPASPAPSAEVLKQPVMPALVAAEEVRGDAGDAPSPRPGRDLSHQAFPVSEAPALPLSQPGIQKTVIAPTPGEEAAARYRKALAAVDKGNARLGRTLLDEALALSPGHAEARQLLATLLNEEGQSREAEAVLRAGLTASPTHAWFPLALARLQAARGEEDVAAATLGEGLEWVVPDGEYHATLAALHLRLKRPAEAAAQYKLALKSRSDQGSWWLGLALALEGQGKMDDAQSAYGRALAAGNLPERLVDFVQKRITH